MLTPNTFLAVFRLVAVIGGAGTVLALLGPFAYDDLGLPFPDFVAHALLFYAVSMAGFLTLPMSRRNDLILAVFGLALASEIAQAAVGRSMSMHDLLGDAAGIVLASAPLYAARFRELARRDRHTPFAELSRRDRRRRSRAPAAATRPAETAPAAVRRRD